MSDIIAIVRKINSYIPNSITISKIHKALGTSILRKKEILPLLFAIKLVILHIAWNIY
ncbi:MAG: hypothetical protein BAJALOKI2v1_70037 [Promethearchaeota archaeon]|nr:MAG: hypothetical protein BAJALOKI2v1_70037 [Candidatus Lokiarchaeota archaeon]